jgi:hypothetical protein
MNAALARVKDGRFVLVPTSPETHGHQSLRFAGLWKGYLAEFVRQPEATTDRLAAVSRRPVTRSDGWLSAPPPLGRRPGPSTGTFLQKSREP